MILKHGSLFSGIGGFDLAAEKTGWENVFHCEWNPFGQRILKYYWPNAISYEDITKTDFTIHRGEIDILTGGFPCQPFSHAGKREGTEDDRYLWPEYLRAIREIQPLAVVGENVAGILSMAESEMFAKVESNGTIRYRDLDTYEAIYTQQKDMLLNNICEDLEKEGYQVQTFTLPAAGVGAPHKRDRVWIVAINAKRQSNGGDYPRKSTREGLDMDGEIMGSSRRKQSTDYVKPSSKYGSDSNSTSDRWTRERTTPQEEIRQPEPGYTWNMERRSEGLCNDGDATHTDCPRCERSEISGQQIQGNNRTKRISEEGTTSDSKPGRLQTGQLVSEGVSDCSQGGEDSTANKSAPPERISSNSNGLGLRGQSDRIGESGFTGENKQGNYWQDFPTQSPVCDGDDGLSSRLDGITFSKWRNESIKGGGNAIVHQVALKIFKAIEEFKIQTICH